MKLIVLLGIMICSIVYGGYRSINFEMNLPLYYNPDIDYTFPIGISAYDGPIGFYLNKNLNLGNLGYSTTYPERSQINNVAPECDGYWTEYFSIGYCANLYKNWVFQLGWGRNTFYSGYTVSMKEIDADDQYKFKEDLREGVEIAIGLALPSEDDSISGVCFLGYSAPLGVIFFKFSIGVNFPK